MACVHCLWYQVLLQVIFICQLAPETLWLSGSITSLFGEGGFVQDDGWDWVGRYGSNYTISLLEYNNPFGGEMQAVYSVAIWFRAWVTIFAALIMLIDNTSWGAQIDDYVAPRNDEEEDAKREKGPYFSRCSRTIQFVHVWIFTICLVTVGILPNVFYRSPAVDSKEFSFLAGADCDGVAGLTSNTQVYSQLCGWNASTVTDRVTTQTALCRSAVPVLPSVDFDFGGNGTSSSGGSGGGNAGCSQTCGYANDGDCKRPASNPAVQFAVLI